MRDLKSDILVQQSVAPDVYNDSVTGTPVDRVGFESVTALVHVGDWVDGKLVFGADHSEDGAEWDAVDPKYLIGEAVVEDHGGSPDGSNDANSTLPVGYVGARRFFRPKITVTGSPVTGCFVGVDVVLGHAHDKPTS